MSLIRWGEDGSNVYVIGSGEGETPWHCVACKFGMSDDDLREHFVWHVEQGHCVPRLALDRLSQIEAEAAER